MNKPIPKQITPEQIRHLANDCPFDFGRAVASLGEGDCLGCGGDLSVATLLHAYRCGVFPWFNAGEPIAWWSPNPRCVIVPSQFVPAKSLRRTAKTKAWHITTNLAFAQVLKACSEPRAYATDTWINPQMQHAYTELHRLGVAISVEVWQGEPMASELIGGLYGVNVGAIFCGESMFHKQANASKVAFWALMVLAQTQGVKLVDCQLENPHLMSLGATLLPRSVFLDKLAVLVDTPCGGLGEVHYLSSQQLVC